MIYFVLDLKIKENRNANPTAAAMPAAVASNPPVNAPSSPLDSTADIAPLASDAPKPMIGTLIPACANCAIGSKILKACNTTPIKTNNTKILADVIFVVIIKICPSIQTNPPIKNTHKNSILHPHFQDNGMAYSRNRLPLLRSGWRH